MRNSTMIPGRDRTIPIRCHCGTPVAELTAEGDLLIIARHHGQAHPVRIRFSEIVRLRQELSDLEVAAAS